MTSTLTAPAAPQRGDVHPEPLLVRAAQLPEVRWAALATGLFALGGLAQLGGTAALAWALYFACYAAGGWEPGLAGLRALRERTLDVDLLMVVAAVLAASIGQVLDGALLIVIFATSGALEAVATARTEDAVRALLTVAPETATRLRDGEEEVVEAADLAVGDLVLVRPGERLSADGTVVDGTSEVDQATITGEPLPALKQPGSAVFAGTLNGAGALTLRVDRPATDSVVARIAALVEEASATKARTQLFVEGIEQRYSLGMVAATLALLVVPLLAGAEFQPTLLRAMTFMIVASPCAVVLATMPPLLAAVANAGRHGVLVKSAVVMEQLGTATVAAFDKTGTLTEGTPQLVDVQLLAGLCRDEVLRLAAGAERPSEHPLARAVVRAAVDAGLPVPAARDFSSNPGRGVSAVVEGRWVDVGRPEQRPVAEERTEVVVSVDGTPVAVLALTDRLRPAATEAVRELKALTGADTLLLTGDAHGPARAVAREAGVDRVRAGLLPAQKADVVRAEQAAGARVLLVGDGVNDAPALAVADIGIAMGRHGSDLALETADAVVLGDDLATVPALVALSRRARRVVLANLGIAAAFITVLTVWDLLGDLPLPLGVLGHEGSTVIVGLNGLRLLRRGAWRA
ncbi:heavy metal-(Cd/Co/Hg/Pb/Zn)-translocating P-type ATPase [Motilibacter rhizosphaerae]|uniref:Heavy metal-(Cd/Co/Hg/Pb/Zn)-translocating P-type ATPase n=1 Tax=Motilibacter rhizosphaerae TaxID=598652 RepID=A0A4Q7NVP2_9ACTN|nr:heavy metal translocating P-type ATPase [Motilibacter rhizosphaerae]RZS91321.1 heavy metal-(Cd/Co/Hg/Pb/Zn)-translocating P-type ATPase [Motilibacter rhizosphaerae]